MEKELLGLNLQLFADEDAGVEDSEVAELDEEVIEDENPSDEVEEDDEVVEDEQPEPPSEEDFKNAQNATFANMRRKAESEAKAKYDAEIARLCEGYVHPITGQPIRSLAEYKDALYQQDRLANEQKLKESGLDPNMINMAVANNPAVKEAQAVLQNVRFANAQRELENEFAEIQKLDPNVTSFDDIPNIEIITDMVERGYRLTDAYKLVNFDYIMQSKTAGAKQGAINQIKGKSHMTGLDSLAQDTSGEEIPTDVYKAYKEIYPDKSGAELKKLYNKTMKKLGGK